jgi:hypothetical protein
MLFRRIVTATAWAMLIVIAGAAPASATPPVRQPPPPERPMTAEEQAASNLKIAAAERYVASPEARASVRTTLACVTPEAAPTGGQVGTTSTAGSGATTQAGCTTPSGFLPVSARDQINGFYCGPAVGQVIANYAWAVGANVNRYAQKTIAGWMQTDVFGGTSAYSMEAGLERATRDAPRRPAGWDWVVSPLQDTDRDGTVGDQLHSYVRSNVSGSRMPLAISVKPHDANGRFHLSSWPLPVVSVGHWISAYGWWGLYDGTDFARLYYTDSSKDEGGGTGTFWDPIRHIGGMIRDHTQRFVW